jgi:(4S)-4-hydroxy-5-phosphonooxypentane-2,3-dione isomerase
MYIVTVEFTVKPEHVASFMLLIVDNARASREQEPGCRQFDVCVDPAAREAVFLYEAYDDRAAFDAHLASAHFKSFDAAVPDMVVSKAVRTYVRSDPH